MLSQQTKPRWTQSASEFLSLTRLGFLDRFDAMTAGTNANVLTRAEMEARLENVRRAPEDDGVLKLLVSRPQTGERRVLESGQLSREEGLVGDNWKHRPSKKTADGSPFVEMQLTVMSSRVIEIVAADKARWPLAGDQLFVDLDLSVRNLPVGTQLTIGDAVIEVTAPLHTGCKKFGGHFGADALAFVNSPVGLELRLRGLNARVIREGTVRPGDRAKKVKAES